MQTFVALTHKTICPKDLSEDKVGTGTKRRKKSTKIKKYFDFKALLV